MSSRKTMPRLCIAFLFLLFSGILFDLKTFAAAPKPKIKPKAKPDDSILFYGGSKVWFAQHREDGFVNLVKRQASLMNVTVYAEGFRNATVGTVRSGLDERVLTEYMHDKSPTFLVIMVGDDDILGKSEGKWIEEDPSMQEIMITNQADKMSGEVKNQYFRMSFQTHLHTILSSFADVNTNTTFILCSPTIFGELYDGKHVLDETFEIITGAVQSVVNEFTGNGGGKAAFLNLRMPMLKYLERSNYEEVPAASMLTYDGHHLNEDGHTLVALTLCQFLGIPTEPTTQEILVNGTSVVTKTPGLETASLNAKLQRRANWKAEERRLKRAQAFAMPSIDGEAQTSTSFT